MKNKTFKFNTEGDGKYEMKVNNIQGSANNFQFDVAVKPPKGHTTVLRNVKVSNGEVTIPRGSGFTINPTRRLRKRLKTVAETLSVQIIEERKVKKTKTTAKNTSVKELFFKLNTKTVKKAKESKSNVK